MVFWALNTPFFAFEGRLMVLKICVGSISQCTYIYCPKKTKCVLRSITRSRLEKTVLLWNWNDLGSWSSGQRLLRCRIFFWEAKKPSWDRSEWSPVGVPQGKTHSGTFCSNFFLLCNIPYIQLLLFYFFSPWLVDWSGFVYLHLLGPWMHYSENSS